MSLAHQGSRAEVFLQLFLLAFFLAFQARRRQLRVALETGSVLPQEAASLISCGVKKQAAAGGHPGVKMGFPGDIPPPANHGVYLGILGVPGG